jgi:hypothetical protein
MGYFPGRWSKSCYEKSVCPTLLRVALLTANYQAMYQFYQVLICLLKFDFFAFTGVTIQVGVTIHFACDYTDLIFGSFSSSFFPRIQPSSV